MFRFLGKAVLNVGAFACMFGGRATRRMGIEIAKKAHRL